MGSERERNATRMQELLDRLQPLEEWLTRAPRSRAQIEDCQRGRAALARYAKEGYVGTVRFKGGRRLPDKSTSRRDDL
jgi:hypothetical protein